MVEKGLVHIVDDDDAIRLSLEFLLLAAGYRVERWQDGESFLNGVDRTVPACVLLDVRMAGLDGFEVQARMLAAGLDFPLIMLTGHGDIKLAVQAIKTGSVDFLEKPFDGAKLLEALELGFDRLADRASQLEQSQGTRAQLARLTDREREVLDGLSCGYPNKTIAYDMGISPRTVEIFRARIMTKLEVHNFADALRISFTAGLGSQRQWREAHDNGRKQTGR